MGCDNTVQERAMKSSSAPLDKASSAKPASFSWQACSTLADIMFYPVTANDYSTVMGKNVKSLKRGVESTTSDIVPH